MFAGGGGRLPHAHAALCQTGTPAGAALVGRKQGVAFDQVDSCDGQPEFVRRHLPDRDAQPGAQIHFAGKHGRRAIRLNREKTVDFRAINGLPGKSGGHCFAGLPGSAPNRIPRKTN